MGPQPSDQSKEGQKVKRRPGRAPTSCAECRRLKLRCDRKVPCETCTKRGCASICPDGSLTTSKGNRLVLANTEELHEKIDRLCSRIRELEDALRALQSHISDQPHPLLMVPNEDMPSSPSAGPSSRDHTQKNSPQPQPQSQPISPISAPPIPSIKEEEIIDAFGTLTIGPSGETAFLGKTARSEFLIDVNTSTFPRALPFYQYIPQAPSASKPSTAISFPHFSEKILQAVKIVRDHEFDDDDLGQELLSLLPPLAEALQLCECYTEAGKHLWCPISRTELIDDCLMFVYQAPSFAALKSNHALSLLFSIFALATLYDPTRPAYSVEAKEYYLLARVAFNFAPSPEKTTVTSLQAMLHIAQFMELSDLELQGATQAWIYVGQAVKLGHMIGLHMNSARWQLDKASTERRSRIFWQLFLLDIWTSFGSGRPPNMYLSYIDCDFPEDTDGVVNAMGRKEIGYHTWSRRYAVLMHTVMETAFSAKMPAYTTVLELDRKVRDFHVPSHLQPRCDDTGPPEVTMQRWFVLSSKEATLLNLHRSYFAQALHDQPHDLLKHKYGPSVIAAYRSAWRVIEGLKIPANMAPHLIARVSLAWSQALAAAIVMCLVVTRAPTSTLTKSSLEQLDRTCLLFEQAAPTCPPAARNLESIRKLRRKAHEASSHSFPDMTNMSHTELDRLGGKTHLISTSRLPPSRAHSLDTSVASGSGSHSSYSSPSEPHFEFGYDYGVIENLHPTIIRDMKVFDGVDMTHFQEMFDAPSSHVSPDVLHPNHGLVYTHGNFGMGPAPAEPANFVGPAPVLDATWQSFVEQLGF